MYTSSTAVQLRTAASCTASCVQLAVQLRTASRVQLLVRTAIYRSTATTGTAVVAVTATTDSTTGTSTV